MLNFFSVFSFILTIRIETILSHIYAQKVGNLLTICVFAYQRLLGKMKTTDKN